MSILPLVVLNGPTASGKSTLAIDLARLLQSRGQAAEVVNADSMLVYRGMDIGTAKPTADERAGVVHHLIDILDVRDTASVADFRDLARRTIAETRSRGVIPILVGGSALYVRTIVDQFDFPGTDPAVRARYEAELERVGAPALHRLLAERSPSAAADILPGNGRRIVRALEVVELTGKYVATLPEPRYALDSVHQWGLEVDRVELDQRIAARVELMWLQGFVDEVRELETRGLREGLTARRALGYRQILSFLEGEFTEAQARERTASGTRRFARKQLGWFRRDPRIRWLPAGAPANAGAIADAIAFDQG